jgi:RNA polymerase sigma factor (sigma-70 family)
MEHTFEELVVSYRDELRLRCYRMLGSSHDADDMVQETFVRAWRAKGALGDPRAARAWIYRIGTNVCLDELARRLKRSQRTPGLRALRQRHRYRLQNRPGSSLVPTFGSAVGQVILPSGSSSERAWLSRSSRLCSC